MSSSAAQTPTRSSGLSLLHVLLILVSFGTVACVGILSWFSRSEVTLDNAIQLLVDDLQLVQDRAAFERRALTVIFHAGGRGYEVVDDRGEGLQALLGSGLFVRQYDADAVFSGVTIEEIDLEGGTSVTYLPTGEAQDQGRIVLAFEGQRRTVTISDGSGQLQVASGAGR